MKDFAESMDRITEIRKGIDHHEPLMKLKLKQYRKYTGKLSWLANAQGTRLDLSYKALTMSKKNATATIADLHNVNIVLKKVEIKESGVSYVMLTRKIILV